MEDTKNRTARPRRQQRIGFHCASFAIFCANVLAAVLVSAAGPSAEPVLVMLDAAPPIEQTNPPPVQIWEIVRRDPRPLSIHVMKVDTRSALVEVVAAIAPDPDGEGPAEAGLTPPVMLAESNRLIAAVNANAFNPVKKPADEKKGPEWVVNLPVDIVGLAAVDGMERSRPKKGYASFWIDPDGQPHVDNIDAPIPVRHGVAGFEQILRHGENLCPTNGPMHPRTTVGVSRDGRFVWMVVVDGRQDGYSEGVRTHEEAALMRELGCWSAANLDGGGSSVMMASGENSRLRILNRPSDRNALRQIIPRPIPTLVGVRLRVGAGGS